MKLIDCHAHLDEFEDVEAVLSRAAAAGVAGIFRGGGRYRYQYKDSGDCRKNILLRRLFPLSGSILMRSR